MPPGIISRARLGERAVVARTQVSVLSSMILITGSTSSDPPCTLCALAIAAQDQACASSPRWSSGYGNYRYLMATPSNVINAVHES